MWARELAYSIGRGPPYEGPTIATYSFRQRDLWYVAPL